MRAYAEAVLDGAIVAGPHVRNACRRHLCDLVEGPARGLAFDREAASRAISFFPDVLRLGGGQFEGKPFVLQPSQAFKIGSVFGWKRADGTRRFRRVYDEEGKGNGKSPEAAGVGLYMMMADGERRAEVYAAAADRDQAMVLFRDAVAAVEQSPALSRRIVKSGNNPVWNLAHMPSGSFFRPISSEKRRTGSGPRPSCALCDEVHEHPDRDIIETLERGFKWRLQPLLWMTTNSGSDRKSVCWEQREHAIRCAAGTRTPDEDFTFVGEAIDDTTFAYVCSLDRGDDWLDDESCWPKVNPLLGVTIQPQYLRDVVGHARSMPGSYNSIARLHFCTWTDAQKPWMGRVPLEAVLADVEPSEHFGRQVFVGLDLSATTDLTAMAFVAPTGVVDVERIDRDGNTHISSEPTYDAWVEAWTPAATLRDRAVRDQAPYEVWHRQGVLNMTPGPTVKLGFVAARLAEASSEHNIALVAYDRYAFRKFEDECEAFGIEVPFVEHPQGGRRRARPSEEQLNASRAVGEETPQGLWMPGSVAELETLILERRIRLKRSPLLIAACMSAVLERDPFDNKWFSKRKATNRIDAVVALAMATGAATCVKSTSPSFEAVLASIAMIDLGGS